MIKIKVLIEPSHKPLRVGWLTWCGLLLLTITHPAQGARTAAIISKPFVIQRQFEVGGSGGWDYLSIESSSGRLFVSRGDRVLVVNTLDGATVGTIGDTQGVHGIALAPDLGMGFTSNGHADTVTVFDLKTLMTTNTIGVNARNPDAILYDPASKQVYTFNGRSQDISVIDPLKGAVTSTLPAGGKPEFAVADGLGRIFFNIEDKSELGLIDSSATKVISKWLLPGCEEPTGLAIDIAHHRLFSVCANSVLVVTDANSGKSVARIPIGKGPDAAAFDAERGLVFSSNGLDGTLTVIHEDDPDHFSVLDTVSTQKSARTMVLDPRTHQIYLSAAQFVLPSAPSPVEPHPRPTLVDGTFKILVVGN
jgi:YVTN family beta-propeller protein